MNSLAVITGTTHGIGRVTARELVTAGFHVVMLCRDVNAAATVCDEVRQHVPGSLINTLHCDLAQLPTVRTCAQNLRQRFAGISLLINNAGTAATGNRRTRSGMDLNFATNHLGHFLLTQLLLDRMTPSGRIITVASRAHYRGRLDLDAVCDPRERIGPMASYARSKLANVLHSFALARRLEHTSITANCLHPGIVASNLLPRWLRLIKPLLGSTVISEERGARTTLHLALSPELATTRGKYFDEHQQPQRALPLAYDLAVQDELWRRSEQWMAP